MTVRVYTDGSGTTGGPAGIAYAAYELGYYDNAIGAFLREGSLSLRDATNQQAEILAAAYALHELTPGPDIVVVSDSEYVVKGVTEWLPGWISRGWRTASNKPVKNKAHWLRLLEAIARHDSVKFEWVRGHNGEPGNERADELAGLARAEALQAAA